MIRNGYRARGTVPQQRAASLGQTAQLVRRSEETIDQNSALTRLLDRACKIHAPVETKSLIGVPGAGKSRTMQQVAALYPKSISFPASRDPRLPPLAIPVLVVEAPADRTIPSLHAAIVAAIQHIIGEEVPPGLKRGNRSERIAAIAQILQHFHVGILILDEIQKLVRHGRPDYVLLNFILEIANTLKVPVLFVGTPASQKLLASELRNARRMLGPPWFNYFKDSAEWNRLFDALWPYQFTDEFAAADQALKDVFYDQSVGLPGFLTRLFRESQRVLLLSQIRGGRPANSPNHLTPQLVTGVASAIFAPARPMLNALRGKNLAELACFEDLTLDDRLIDAQIKELAEYRRRELLRTISAVRNTSAKERRRAKAAIRQEVDDLIGSVKAADAANMLPPVAEKANTSSEPSGAPISSAQS
jgi:hypothetical protein